MIKTVAILATAVAILVEGITASDAPSISGVAYFRQATASVTHTGAFPGATQAWFANVLLLHEPKVIGHGGIACVYVNNTVRECFGTYVLPEGRIKVLGEITSRSAYTLAIIGGTGVYQNASGVAAFTPGLATFYLS